MALIRQLKSFLAKTNVYPKTLTSAVYDNEGNRLDNKLGAASLSGYADGTITGAVKSACDDVATLKSDVNQINSNLNSLNSDVEYLQSLSYFYKTTTYQSEAWYRIAMLPNIDNVWNTGSILVCIGYDLVRIPVRYNATHKSFLVDIDSSKFKSAFGNTNAVGIKQIVDENGYPIRLDIFVKNTNIFMVGVIGYGTETVAPTILQQPERTSYDDTYMDIIGP